MEKSRTRALILMIVVVGLLNADQNLINSTLGDIEREFRVGDADIGFMSAMFTVLGAVVSLAVGYLSDKWNRKLLFTYSVLLSEISCLLTAFSRNYAQFFACRILTGFGVGASFPVIFSFMGDLYNERERASAVAWMTTVMGIGQIVGQVVGGYVGPSAGWRVPFVIVSAPNLLFLLAFFILVDEPMRGASEASLDSLIEEGLLYPRSIKPKDYLRLFKVRTNLFLFVQGIIGTVPWGAIPLFIVKFLNEDKSLSIEAATTVFLLFGLGNIVGTILGGLIGGKILARHPPGLPRFCAATTVAGTAATLYLFLGVKNGDIVSTLVLGFAAAFFVSITGPNMRTMLLDVNVPENRGAIFSVFNLTDSVGTGIGKWVAGALSLSFGLRASMTACAAFWIPCAFFLWIASLVFLLDMGWLRDQMAKVADSMKAERG